MVVQNGWAYATGNSGCDKRVDRHAREDEANLAQEEDEEADDDEYEVQPVPASWNREDLGYIGENELQDTNIFRASHKIIAGSTAVIPSIPHTSTTDQWQGGFVRFAGSSQMVPPMHTEAGSSQFQGAFSGVPQVNMPVFSTGMYNPEQMMGYAGST
uniref:Uncharacterized protein n=1 Tax=Oryza sativa subsp. japonica TaxID=39947 RepID=Q10GW7_ORYSJ|nr:hypothetical protein LOC_Os03g41480 [Oryza sativa Japonica Group]